MTEVGSAYVSILPSTKGFGRRLSSELDGPSFSAGRSAGSRAGEGFSRSLLPSVKGIASAAGGLLAGSALFKLGGLGLRTAAGMEQAKIAFTTMLGSAQKANTFLQQLQQFAAKTPFEFPELQTAASSLISVGVNAKDVIPIMTTLGNVTSGMGTGSEGVRRATVALQQMIAAQRISGEDLNQLRDAGIPVFDLLSKSTGKSTAEVVKLAQAGKLGKKELNQMLDALRTGKGMERFTGLMDKQSQSLTGLWSTFKDTLGQGLARLIGPAIPALKSGLNTVSNVLAGFFNGVQGTVKIMSTGRPIAEELGLGIRALVLAFKDGDVTSNGFIGAMERVGATARAAFAGIRDGVRQVLPALKQFASGVVVPAISQLAEALRNVWAAIEPKLIAAAKAVATVIGVALVGAVQILGPLLVGITGFFKDHKNAAVALAAVIATLVLVTKAHAAVLAVEAAGGLISYLRTMKLVTVATKVWAAVQWLLNAALSANPIALVVIGIAALAAGLVLAYKKSETFRNIVHAALHAVATAVDFVKDHWQAFATAFAFLIGGPIIGGITLLITHFSTVKRVAEDVFKAVGHAAESMWDNVIRPVFKFIVDSWFTVVGALVHGAAAAFGWVPGLGGRLKSAARKFDEFRDSVNTALDGIHDRDVKVNIHTVVKGFAATHGDEPRRALGGPVWPGQDFLVGEHGPELVRFGQRGTVINANRTQQLLSQPAMGGGLTIEQLLVTAGPDERAEESVPRGLGRLVWQLSA